MKKFKIVLIFVFAYMLTLSANESKLVGEWSGPGKIVLNKDGSGYLGTALCNANIQWSATDTEIHIHYLTAVECSYNDAQIGNVEKKMKKPKDEVIRYEISKSNELGFDTMKMVIYSRTAPNGVSYLRPLKAGEKDRGKKLTRKECREEIANQTRECDSKGGSDMDLMMCKNAVMMNHLDCI